VEREAILRKMRALAAKQVENGCSEAEALSAANLLGRMMDQHGFSQLDLSEKGKASELKTDIWRSPAGKNGSLVYVSNSVAGYCDCKVWLSGKGTASEGIAFFGHEEDTMLASFLMDSFNSAMNSEWAEYRRSMGAVVDPKTGRPKAVVSVKERETFELGMMGRLSGRLREMKVDRNSRVDEPTGRTGNALVVVKTAAVDAGFKQLGITLGKARASRKRLRGSDAYAAGRAAGGRVAITTGIAG
jgi:hypothetical protein